MIPYNITKTASHTFLLPSIIPYNLPGSSLWPPTAYQGLSSMIPFNLSVIVFHDYLQPIWKLSSRISYNLSEEFSMNPYNLSGTVFHDSLTT